MAQHQTYTHLPTGNTCTILRLDGGRAFCDFGSKAAPFTWVPYAELRATCGACGGLRPIDQSCGCFDNGCQ